MGAGTDVGSRRGGYSSTPDAGGGGTAVVLAGAGARGAYEAGVLSVLLPALPEKRRPTIFVGTSAGAINAAGLAAFAHLGPAEATARLIEQWRQLRQKDVFRSVGGTTLRNLATLLRGRTPRAVLDSAPLWDFLGQRVSFDQLRHNISSGRISACAVVSTDQWTHRNAVFTECAEDFSLPANDDVRAIDYRRVTLDVAHVMASAAIPGLFPAIDIPPVPGAPVDWFVDGGVRLNTPIKPALKLGADRLIVVATSPEELSSPDNDDVLPPPGATSGLVDLARAVMDDPLVADLAVLRRDNERAVAPTNPALDKRVIPHVFVGPPNRTVLGELARDVLRRRSWWPPHTIGRMVANSADLCELAGHVLFDREFIAGAIHQGQEDARRKLVEDAVEWRDEEAASKEDAA